MKTLLTFAAALFCTTSAAADGHAQRLFDEQRAVIAGAEAFFAALQSDDKTALAGEMLPEGVIFIHNRRDPENPVVITRTVAEHLEGWARGTRSVDEVMVYENVLIDGDMAQVWGPYAFWVEGELSHCGVNSLSMVRTEDGSWKVGNTAFSMVPPSECETYGAPETPE